MPNCVDLLAHLSSATGLVRLAPTNWEGLACPNRIDVATAQEWRRDHTWTACPCCQGHGLYGGTQPGVFPAVRSGEARHLREVLQVAARHRRRPGRRGVLSPGPVEATFAVLWQAAGVAMGDVISLLGEGSVLTTERYCPPWNRHRCQRLERTPALEQRESP